MMDPTMWKVVSEYGLGVSIFLLLVYVIKKAIDLIFKSIDLGNKEREKWQNIINSHADYLTKLQGELIEFRNQNSEAHKYQRDEHFKIIDLSNKLCSELEKISENSERYHESMVTEQDYRRTEHTRIIDIVDNKIVPQLDEQYKILLRINGEKH